MKARAAFTVTLDVADSRVEVGLSKGAMRQVRRNCGGRHIPHSVMTVQGLQLYHRFHNRLYPVQEAVDRFPSAAVGLIRLAGRVQIGDREIELPRKALIQNDRIQGIYPDGSEKDLGPVDSEMTAALQYLRLL